MIMTSAFPKYQGNWNISSIDKFKLPKIFFLKSNNYNFDLIKKNLKTSFFFCKKQVLNLSVRYQ